MIPWERFRNLSFMAFFGLTKSVGSSGPQSNLAILRIAHGAFIYICQQGFFDHVTADTDHKFIRDWIVTPANVHDSSPYLSILPERAIGDKTIYADSAYSASEIMAELEYRGFHPKICEKGYKGDPLTEEQKSKWG